MPRGRKKVIKPVKKEVIKKAQPAPVEDIDNVVVNKDEIVTYDDKIVKRESRIKVV